LATTPELVSSNEHGFQPLACSLLEEWALKSALGFIVLLLIMVQLY